MKNTKLKPITAEQVIELGCAAFDYRKQDWEKAVARRQQVEPARFFYAPADDVYAYPRFYAIYRIEEGLILFSSVSPSGCLTNNGFTRVRILESSEVVYQGFGDSGTQRIKNNTAGRKWLVDNICKYGTAVTNE